MMQIRRRNQIRRQIHLLHPKRWWIAATWIYMLMKSVLERIMRTMLLRVDSSSFLSPASSVIRPGCHHLFRLVNMMIILRLIVVDAKSPCFLHKTGTTSRTSTAETSTIASSPVTFGIHHVSRTYSHPQRQCRVLSASSMLFSTAPVHHFAQRLVYTRQQHEKQKRKMLIPLAAVRGSQSSSRKRILLRHIFTTTTTSSTTTTGLYQSSSFTADGSEYASMDDPDSTMDDDDMMTTTGGGGSSSSSNDGIGGGEDGIMNRKNRDQDDTPTIELQPIPLSKNAGNRFVAFIWDADFNPKKEGKQCDPLDLHYDRIALTEQHVMYCRKANLYNDTFNTNSMVDVRWSLPILSCDLQRVIGHAMCIESTQLHYAREFLMGDPIVQMLTSTTSIKEISDGDSSSSPTMSELDDADTMNQIPLYRWRHIRDYTLRIDDGRDGYPCLCVAMLDDNDHYTADNDQQQQSNLSVIERRKQVEKEWLQYLIESERIIAAGPLHMPTQFKDDPSSDPVGDLILFNARNREHAIEFVENMPSSLDGLYKSLRVYFYNQLDITGKFVSEDPLRDAPGQQMKEAMAVWGYPVADDQTPWLNF